MTSKNVMTVAREWLVTMRTSANPELVRLQFEAWLLEDPTHLRAYARAESEWFRLDKAVNLLREVGPMPPDALLQEVHACAERTRRRRHLMRQIRNWTLRIASAPTVIVVLSFMHNFPRMPAPPAPWHHYVGSYGTPERYVLNDGSELYLNGKSEASVRMTQEVREVALDEGELLVHVTHDRNRPFLVRAGETIVRAVGTLFSVRRDTTGVVEATVKDGSVTIDPKGQSAAAGGRLLVAGETATISDGVMRVEAHDPTEIENSLAWVHGRLYLHGSLMQAVAQFNRHNEREMVIEDESIASMNVTGLSYNTDPVEFADSLRVRGVRYRLEKGRIVLFAGQ